jgi:hypothetical protein
VDAQVWRKLDEDWALGGRWLWRQTSRDLLSVGDVRGYVERYVQPSWALGMQRTWRTADWGTWNARLWQGQGQQQRMQVTLPTMDPAVLPLGASRWWGAQLQWSVCRSHPDGGGWACNVTLDYQSERVARGAEVPVYRQGVLRLAAHQVVLIKWPALWAFPRGR